MRFSWDKTLVMVLLWASCAAAQLQVGDNTTLNMNGMASVGWVRSYDDIDENSVTWGLNANLKGDYYDPRFLNFSVNPYFNQSRLNSNYYSQTSASGVDANANFLSDSRTPVQVNYNFAHDTSGNFNVPGQVGAYQTVGDAQSIGVSGSYFPDNAWPGITGFFSHAGSSYEVIGQDGVGHSHSTGFGFNSNYDLEGFNIFGSYNRTYVNNESPVLGEPGKFLTQDTNQDNVQVGATRRLFRSTSMSMDLSRSSYHAEYSDVNADATFNTVAASVLSTPTKRLDLNLNLNYSSNLSAQVLSRILGTAPGAKATPETLSYTSDYLNYGLNANYKIATNFTLNGTVRHQIQGQPGDLPDATSTTTSFGAVWSHQVLGGGLGISYGMGYSFVPYSGPVAGQTNHADTSFLGQNAGISYGRRLLGFSGTGSFSYSRSLTTVLVGYIQTTYAANAGLSRQLGKWNMNASAGYSRSHVENVTLSEARALNANLGFSRRSFGLTGSFSHGNGSALQVGTSIVPIVPGTGVTDLLLQFAGNSYGVGGHFRPLRRWTIEANYTNIEYRTINANLDSINISKQFYVRSEYAFRQMFFNAGYNHIRQGFGVGAVNPPTLDTVYFGISRRFDFF